MKNEKLKMQNVSVCESQSFFISNSSFFIFHLTGREWLFILGARGEAHDGAAGQGTHDARDVASQDGPDTENREQVMSPLGHGNPPLIPEDVNHVARARRCAKQPLS